jgi:hypothetical protein
MPIANHFNEAGLLPVGDHVATIEELKQSILVVGPVNPPNGVWDRVWRGQLVDNASILINQLWQVGITEIFLDGSFVEEKPYPHDIDGYFECSPADLVRTIVPTLNQIDPYKIWTWSPASRKPAPGSMKNQLPMWHRYRVELYPHYPGLLTGIRGQHGNDMPFPEAFRQQRDTGLSKGIIKIVP